VPAGRTQAPASLLPAHGPPSRPRFSVCDASPCERRRTPTAHLCRANPRHLSEAIQTRSQASQPTWRIRRPPAPCCGKLLYHSPSHLDKPPLSEYERWAPGAMGVSLAQDRRPYRDWPSAEERVGVASALHGQPAPGPRGPIVQPDHSAPRIQSLNLRASHVLRDSAWLGVCPVRPSLQTAYHGDGVLPDQATGPASMEAFSRVGDCKGKRTGRDLSDGSLPSSSRRGYANANC
jgi:hypothetical protein